MDSPSRSLEETHALLWLGNKISILRVNLHFTQEELAHRAAVAVRTLQNLESGRLNPSYLTLERIARGLETPLADILQEKGCTK